MVEHRQILKVLVGSHAYGLANEDSDWDYRGVYVVPTSDLLRVNAPKVKGTHWVEGETEDDTAYELGHFLHLATKCNPSILEVFVAPRADLLPLCCPDCDPPEAYDPDLGSDLRALFPYVWHPKGVLDAFTGYSLNQRKKMLDDKYEFRTRKWKYAVAYLRTLLQAIGLFRTGRLDVQVPEHWKYELRQFKDGKRSEGEVIDTAQRLTTTLYQEYEMVKDVQHQDLDEVNRFLLRVRQEHWE